VEWRNHCLGFLSTAHCGSYGYVSSRLALASQDEYVICTTIPFPFMLDDWWCHSGSYLMQYAFEDAALFSSCWMKGMLLCLKAYCVAYGYDSSRLTLAKVDTSFSTKEPWSRTA
jgi:hypothetical protein